MPKITKKQQEIETPTPESEKDNQLRPFRFHGVEVEDKGYGQAIGICPFCLKDGKFYINTKNGLWDCKVCGRKGNPVTFLREMVKELDESPPAALEKFREGRGLLDCETLSKWGVYKHHGEYLVEGRGVDGGVNNLYRYRQITEGGKRVYKLLPTPTLTHQLFGMGVFKKKAETVYLCEGPWDGMALWEVLNRVKPEEDGTYSLTSNPLVSLGNVSAVVATPGCNVFNDSWSSLFSGKDLVLCFDNDYPRKVGENGIARNLDPASYGGMKRIVGILSKCEAPPRSIKILSWVGNAEQTHNPKLPAGYDLRDYFKQGGERALERVKLFRELLPKFVPIPKDWVVGRSRVAVKAGQVTVGCKECSSFKQLINQWRKAMKWGEGLDLALSVMLASVTSTKAVGDQLWVKIIGPAGSGKSTLCEALSVNKTYVLAKSTIRGFHSGYMSDADGSKDNSLTSMLDGKTLITKDGDTLLQSPNLGQILSEARDIYDRTARVNYRNGVNREYEALSMTWLLCGTSSLRSIDSSELGERFLDCVIMDGIDDEEEDEILLRVANRVDKSLSLEIGNAENQDEPEMMLAKQLTGGYVDYLRQNAGHLIAAVRADEAALKRCIHLGKFVAYMRARPSTRQDESAEREFAARLVSQLIRLAKCLAVVLNRETLDEEVLRRVREVALATARGKVLDLVKVLYEAGEVGADCRALSLHTNQTEDKERSLLRFLKRIKVVTIFTNQVAKGINGKPRWKLTERLQKLCTEVYHPED